MAGAWDSLRSVEMDTLVGQLVEIVGITRGLKVFDERTLPDFLS